MEEKTLIPAIEDIKTGKATLSAGAKQCTWCPARAYCPENAKRLKKELGFNIMKYSPRAKQVVVKTLSDEQLLSIVNNKDRILNTVKEVEATLFDRIKEKGQIWRLCC